MVAAACSNLSYATASWDPVGFPFLALVLLLELVIIGKTASLLCKNVAARWPMCSCALSNC